MKGYAENNDYYKEVVALTQGEVKQYESTFADICSTWSGRHLRPLRLRNRRLAFGVCVLGARDRLLGV